MGIISSAGVLEKVAFAAISTSVRNRLQEMIEREIEIAVKEIHSATASIINEELSTLAVKTEKDLVTGETIITMQIRSK